VRVGIEGEREIYWDGTVVIVNRDGGSEDYVLIQLLTLTPSLGMSPFCKLQE
jgi:hypothetical protein